MQNSWYRIVRSSDANMEWWLYSFTRFSSRGNGISTSFTTRGDTLVASWRTFALYIKVVYIPADSEHFSTMCHDNRAVNNWLHWRRHWQFQGKESQSVKLAPHFHFQSWSWLSYANTHTSLYDLPDRNIFCLLPVREGSGLNRSPEFAYPDLESSWCSLLPPGNCRVNRVDSNLATAVSFHITSKLLFTRHPIIPRYAV
jgi:hypothetical protein